jgi:ADP-ribosylglycohydrolase
MAALVARASAGEPLAGAARAVEPLLRRHEGHEETLSAMRAALEHPEERDVGRLGEGWIAEEALAIGLRAALVGATFADVIRIGANHDGDSDSTASIAAQLHGAARGLADLPLAWARRLDVLDPLLVLGHDLWSLGEPEVEAIEDYPPD